MVQHSQSQYKWGPCNVAGLHGPAHAAANIIGHMHSEPNIICHRLTEPTEIPQGANIKVGEGAA